MATETDIEPALGFWRGRARLDLGVSAPGPKLMRHPNVPPIVAVIVSTGLATYTELGTVLGVEDAHNLLEIAAVDMYNRSRANGNHN